MDIVSFAVNIVDDGFAAVVAANGVISLADVAIGNIFCRYQTILGCYCKTFFRDGGSLIYSKS